MARKPKKSPHEIRGIGPEVATCAWCFYRQGKHGMACVFDKPNLPLKKGNDQACVRFSPFDGFHNQLDYLGDENGKEIKAQKG